MTYSTNAKLRELRERVAGMPCYDSDGDPAGIFDHHVFVRREDVLRLIDAMIQEAGSERCRYAPRTKRTIGDLF